MKEKIICKNLFKRKGIVGWSKNEDIDEGDVMAYP